LCFGTELNFGGGISFLWFRILASFMSRSPLRLFAGGEAVAFAVHFQNIYVMSEPVGNAPVSRSDPNMDVHSSNGGLVVTIVEPRS
jgi:hypothetical protein